MIIETLIIGFFVTVVVSLYFTAFHWSCRKQIYKDFVCEQHYNQKSPREIFQNRHNQLPESEAVGRLISTRGIAFTMMLLRDANVSKETILKLSKNEGITDQEIQRIRIVLKDQLTDD